MTKEELIQALKAMADTDTYINIAEEIRLEEEQATVYTFDFEGGTTICIAYDTENLIFTPCDWQALISGFRGCLEAIKVFKDSRWMAYDADNECVVGAIMFNGLPRIF